MTDNQDNVIEDKRDDHNELKIPQSLKTLIYNKQTDPKKKYVCEYCLNRRWPAQVVNAVANGIFWTAIVEYLTGGAIVGIIKAIKS